MRSSENPENAKCHEVACRRVSRIPKQCAVRYKAPQARGTTIREHPANLHQTKGTCGCRCLSFFQKLSDLSESLHIKIYTANSAVCFTGSPTPPDGWSGCPVSHCSRRPGPARLPQPPPAKPRQRRDGSHRWARHWRCPSSAPQKTK